MAFMGGKARLSVEIARIIRSKRRNFQPILEPFCGSCAVTQHLYPGTIMASDISESLILMHQALQKNWLPPDNIDEEEYQELKLVSENGEVNKLIGFVGFTSWGGKWWGGYPRSGNRNLFLENKNLLLRRHKLLKNVIFEHKNYKNLEPKNMLIYCDPPYANTTDYNTNFDSKLFWEIIRKWSLQNTVLISEYIAPPDFKIIAEWEHFNSLKSKKTIERLYEKSN